MSESAPGSRAIRQAGLLWALEAAHAAEEREVLRPLRMRQFSEEFYTTLYNNITTTGTLERSSELKSVLRAVFISKLSFF